MENIDKVGAVGAGMMGAEIALCFASSGFEVVMKETTKDLAQKGKDRLSGVLDRAIKKGAFQGEDKDSTLSRIMPTDSFDHFGDVDLVIEAIFENADVKKQIFAELDGICKSDCVFASNTSSIPITLLATALKKERIGQFIGAHFFSPAFTMKLVEVIPGLETKEEVVLFTMECCRKINKVPIRVKDVTGFAVNRILHAMWTEVYRLLEEGVATPEDIDTACKLGLGHPIGPFVSAHRTTSTLGLGAVS